MESLAYIHNAVAYESDEPVPELQPFPWDLPSSAWIATSSLLISLMLTGMDGAAIASVPGVVNTGGSPLNIRSAPDGEVVGKVPDGSALQLTGNSQNGWLQQVDGNWVMSRYVESTPTEAAETALGGQRQTAYANTNGAPLNIRKAPNGEIVSTLKDGSPLELTGRSSGDWVEQTNGTWVASQFVRSTPPNTPAAPAPATAAAPTATASAAPVAPSNPAPVASSPAAADPAVAIAANPSPAAQPAAGQGSPAQTGTVNTNGRPLNIRQAPGGNIVGRLQDGEAVELTGRNENGWLERVDGTWVQAQFIQTTDPSPSPSASPSPAATAQEQTTPSPAASPSPSPAATAPSPSPSPAATAPSPSPSPSPSPAATAPSPSPSPAATAPSPSPSPAATAQSPSPSPAATAPSPSPSPAATAQGQTTPRPAASPSPSPAPSPAAIAQGQATPAPQGRGNSASTAFIRTNDTPLNVRSSPGGAVIGSLPNGTQIELTGRSSGEWTEQTNGTWVSSSWISTTGSPSPQPGTPIGSPITTAFARTSGMPLNVRSSPGGAVVGTLANGARVELTGRNSGTWAELTNSTWVSRDWLSVTGTTSPAPEPTPQTPVGDASETAFVSTNGTPLNVRSSPGGAVIGSLPNGARVDLTGRTSGEWSERMDNSWISSNWLSFTGTPNASPEMSEGGDRTTAFVSTNGTPLNVRSAPGGLVIGTLVNGSRIEMSGRSSGTWAERSNGTWISRDWVRYSDVPTEDVGSPDSLAQVSTNGNPLLVRSSPGGAVIGEFTNGSRITLNGRRSGSWLELSNGGWVADDWVTAISR